MPGPGSFHAHHPQNRPRGWGVRPRRTRFPAGIVQYKAAASAAPGATLSVTLDVTPVVGNLLVAFTTSDTTLTSGPSGFTLRASNESGNSVYVHTRTVQSGDGTTITVDPNGDYATALLVIEVKGVMYYGSASTVAYAEGGSTSLTLNSLTPVGDVMYLALVGTADYGSTSATSFSYTSSFTAITEATTSGTTRVSIAAAAVTGSGAKSTTASWTGAQATRAGYIVALLT